MIIENEWISRCKNRGHGDHHKEKRKLMKLVQVKTGVGDDLPKGKRKQMD